MDASIDARGEFRAFRDRVRQDDLPAFEVEFKRQLNTNTIRELAGFASWLRRQADEIHARVDRINEALGAIDYSPGRYITLVAERTVNQEVQAFRSESASGDRRRTGLGRRPVLRAALPRRAAHRRALPRPGGPRRCGQGLDQAGHATCATGSPSPPPSGSAETGEEWEHYRDSDGKSGGQKEKLAYTILAASLAYQFGLEWGAERSRDFRFAVIDEAFGRGSDAVHPLRPRAVRQARPAAAHRHAAAEGPRHRAVRPRHRLRRQPERQLLAPADADHRGVPQPAGALVGRPVTSTWTTPADLRPKVRRRWTDGSLLRALAAGRALPDDGPSGARPPSWADRGRPASRSALDRRARARRRSRAVLRPDHRLDRRPALRPQRAAVAGAC